MQCDQCRAGFLLEFSPRFGRQFLIRAGKRIAFVAVTLTLSLIAAGCAFTRAGSQNTAPGPSFTTQPSSQSVVIGQTATFAVVASGTAPLSYQWKRNGGNVGGNSASYTTAATTSADNGASFQVVVSNSAG